MQTLKILTLALFISLATYGRGRINGYCQDGGKLAQTVGQNSTTKLLQSYPGCTVTVYISGTLTLAPIFSDNIGTVKANPFTADAVTGAWFYYTNDGTNDVKLSGGGIPTPFTLGAISIIDPFYTGNSSIGSRFITNKLTCQQNKPGAMH